MSSEERTWKRHITKILVVILILFVLLATLQWIIIKELFGFGADMMKDAMIKQAPEEVSRADIEATCERVKTVGQQLPFSLFIGRINLGKIKKVADYAIAANDDDTWDAEEINTLLQMLNASIGFKQEAEN